jgi:acetylornithine deacetylase/succinyl-diaminopimelate desuccinylase-like protein
MPAPAPLAVPTDEMRALMQRPDVARAMEAVERDREAIVAQWRAVTEIPAPSGHEAQRAAYVENLLRSYRLENVHRDAVGNVVGTRRGAGGGKHVVFDSHLDTVFALDTDVKTRVENGRIYAPGVGDDTRNVIAMLAMIRAMNEAHVETKGDLTFVFTVEEETSFKGVDRFLADHAGRIDRYVAMDGGYTSFTYGGTGIYWHRYHIIGPGGHTRSRTPPVSATLPLARAAAHLRAGRAGDVVAEHRHARRRGRLQREGGGRLDERRPPLDGEGSVARTGRSHPADRERRGGARRDDHEARRGVGLGGGEHARTSRVRDGAHRGGGLPRLQS